MITTTATSAFAPLDIFRGDRLPIVSIRIAGKEYEATAYQIDSQVTTLVDTASLTIPNPDGCNSGAWAIGDRIEVIMRDPAVNGGAPSTQLLGIVVNSNYGGDTSTGETIDVQVADLGWHLINSSAPLWKRLNGLTFKRLLDVVIDPTWRFAGTRTENDTNRALNQGRAAIIAGRANPLSILPPIQFEPGQTPGDTLILYARRAKYLVNVSSDGYLQIFRPRYDTPIAAWIKYYKSTDTRRSRNNVLAPIRVTQSIDGLYTSVTCVWTTTRPVTYATPDNPNEGQGRGRYEVPTTLPFNRSLTFSDSEPLTQEQAFNRAQWRHRRGRFDSFAVEYKVYGHSSNDLFYAPDTMIQVDDEVHKIKGRYYVAGRRFSRTLQGGTTTTLTLRQPNLLAA